MENDRDIEDHYSDDDADIVNNINLEINPLSDLHDQRKLGSSKQLGNKGKGNINRGSRMHYGKVHNTKERKWQKRIKQASHGAQRSDIRNKISRNTLEGKEDIVPVVRNVFL